MSTVPASDLAAVKRVLAAGQTSTVEASTGRHQSLYANCPNDGQPSPVRRISREGNNAIFELTMRCVRCATDFVAPTESLYFR